VTSGPDTWVTIRFVENGSTATKSSIRRSIPYARASACLISLVIEAWLTQIPPMKTKLMT
jgi:hypothetical protein